MKLLTIRFEAKISKGKPGFFIDLPKSVYPKLPAADKTMLEGIINHFPFRGFLASKKNGRGIEISNAVRKAARAEEQAMAELEITRVGDEPETRIPADLKKALAANAKARAAWNKITPMARRDWILSICVVKQAETRRGRLIKTCDMLARGKGRVCCFPGINWITRDYARPEETWQKLPKLKI